MTVQTETGKAVYVANGSTVSFTVPFCFFDKQIAVYVGNSETPLTEGTDYTVSGSGNLSGGTITFATAPDNGKIVTIVRDVELKQLITFIEGENFPAGDYEYSLDKIVMALQQLRDKIADCVSIPAGSTLTIADMRNLLNELNDNLDTIVHLPEMVTAVVNAREGLLLDYYTKTEVDNKIAGAVLKFTDKTIAPSAVVEDSTYEDYPYRADIVLTGAKSTHIPSVTLGLTEALSGIFAPICVTSNGSISLYLTKVPSSTVTIPAIILH